MQFYRKALILSSLVLLISVVLLALVLVPASSKRVQAAVVIRLTDVPGRWFDPPITSIAPDTSVKFQTTTFGGTFTSAIFPCTRDSIHKGNCSLSNPNSFPPGFPFDQPDPSEGQ